MAYEFDDARDEADVFRSAASGKYEGTVIFGFDLVKRGVESEIVAALFGIGLIAFEIVNGGADMLTGFFPRADRVDRMAYHAQRLEWDHYFVVFHVVADDYQDRFLGHESLHTRQAYQMEKAGQNPGLGVIRHSYALS